MAEATDKPKRGRGRPRKAVEKVPMPKQQGGGAYGGSSSSSLSPEKIRGKIDPETVIGFLQSLKIPEGPKAGEPLVLAEYQKRFVRGAMAEGVMVGLLSIGRGNAKTALAAGIALGSLMGVWDDQPRREILMAARNRDQAKTAFGFMVGYIGGLSDEEQELFTIRHGSRLEIEYSANAGGLARCIAADGRSILGGAPTLAILDERAAWERDKGDTLENAILSGLGKRDGKALIISTSAPDDANTFSRWMDDPPPGCYVQEHRPAFGLPADDEASLLIANPGAAEGIGASLEWLVAQARRAVARGGSALSSFRNLNRNERVSIENRSVVLTVDELMSAEVSPDDLPERLGPCILGVDLGGSRSMSAAACFWPETGRLEVLGTFPSKPGLEDRGGADGVAGRYVEMHERGELSVLGENTVPPGPWLAEVVRRLEGIIPACICGDRFRHAEFTEAMNAAGLARVPFIWRGFGWKDGAEDIERFRRAVFDGEVKTVPSLLLRSAFAEAVTLVDPAGNHKLTKARSLGRIDAAAAAILAVAEGARRMARPARKSRGLVWV